MKLAGEVFELNGKVAGRATHNLNKVQHTDDGIPFLVSHFYPETPNCPAWAEMTIGDNIFCRIDPDICQAPFLRLFDCVAMIHHRLDKIKDCRGSEKLRATFGGQEFVFWPEQMNSPFGMATVIMIDTFARLLKWNTHLTQAEDGQHRHFASME